MAYFLRARTHLQYAQILLEDLLSGKRQLTFNQLKEILWQVLKALYAITETKALEKSPTPEEVINKILSNLNEEERQKILHLKDMFFSEKAPDIEPRDLRKLLNEVMDVVRWSKELLKI